MGLDLSLNFQKKKSKFLTIHITQTIFSYIYEPNKIPL